MVAVAIGLLQNGADRQYIIIGQSTALVHIVSIASHPLLPTAYSSSLFSLYSGTIFHARQRQRRIPQRTACTRARYPIRPLCLHSNSIRTDGPTRDPIR